MSLPPASGLAILVVGWAVAVVLHLVTRKNKELERKLLGPLADRRTLIWFLCAVAVLAGIVVLGIELAFLIQLIGWAVSR